MLNKQTSDFRYCLLFGADCTEAHRVAVRVHSGYEGSCSVYDLQVDLYIDRPKARVTYLMDGFRELEIEGGNGEDYRLFMVTSKGVSAIHERLLEIISSCLLIALQSTEPLSPNRLLRRLCSPCHVPEAVEHALYAAGAVDPEFCAGNVMVVKCTSDGNVVDMSRSDKSLAIAAISTHTITGSLIF